MGVVVDASASVEDTPGITIMAGARQTEEQDTGPIDREHLHAITFGDQMLERELLSLFGARAAVTLAEIEQATTGEERSAAAHKLAGGARAIGANALAEIAEAIEASPGLTADNVAGLTTAMADVVAFLERRLVAKGSDISRAG